LNIVEEQKIVEKKKSCYLFGVLHPVHEYESKISIQQKKIQQIRKVVKYGRRTKNYRREEKLLTFLCSSWCSWIWEQNIHPT